MQLWLGFGLKIGQQHESIFLDLYPLGKPMLGIVLPLDAEEIKYTLESLQHWPKKCSETTLSRIDLIFYFAGRLPLGLDHPLEEAGASTSCFKMTKMVSAGLHLGVRNDFALSAIKSRYRE